MWLIRTVIVCSVLNYAESKLHRPSIGSVWPRPAQEWQGFTFLYLLSEEFTFEVENHNCELLDRAIERCKEAIDSVEGIARRVRLYETWRNLRYSVEGSNEDREKKITRLKIKLKQPCENYPYFEMDESYNLTVSRTSTLTSESIWGIIRGLETFSQLFYLSVDYKDVLIKETEIEDWPHYPHRGMMVDTGRHYLPVGRLLATIDAMAMNKMNVFHWHIVDIESFPYQSEVLPELSAQGAFYPTMVYTKKDIQRIVEFARERGIRVIPEIDTPGHASSWGASHPEILARCSSESVLNPVKNETYELLAKLFHEVQEWFPDSYFHLGGDEVDTGCWKQDPEISEFMREQNIKNPAELQRLYTERIMKLLKNGTVPIFWEEVFFDANTSLPKDALVHIWGWEWPQKMVDVLKRGHKVLFSSYWYLNYNLQQEFADYYTGDPRLMVYNITRENATGEGIVGGQACLWGEMVDGTNLLSRMWPRGSSAAEVLWSVTDGTVPPDTWNRIEEHACRMIRRGIPAEPPSGPGFCVDIHNAVPDDIENSITIKSSTLQSSGYQNTNAWHSGLSDNLRVVFSWLFM